ncbi:MAG TPA: hypothetical protein VFM25_06230, partial [Verrucomicrobiae bacterium]|nr:hypothetical protein [Verrucomicrobiae bacterium]
MTTRRRRVIFRIVSALALGFAIALAALPLWFPWVARPLAKSLGITYTDYQRDGYARFHVSNLVLRAKSGVFNAKRAGAFVPTAWLWRMAFGTNAAPFLTASAWEFSFQQNSNAPASSSSVFTNVAKLNDTFKTLRRWLPEAEFTNGTIRAKEIQIAVPNANWKNGALAAKIVLPQNRPFALNADWPANGPLKLSLASVPLNFQTELSLAKTNSNSVRLSANGVWSSNRFELSATFPKNGWIPKSANARADSFQIPASLLKLGNYEKIAGSLDGDWNGARYTMNLTARAIPKSAALPEWNIEARASGDT